MTTNEEAESERTDAAADENAPAGARETVAESGGSGGPEVVGARETVAESGAVSGGPEAKDVPVQRMPDGPVSHGGADPVPDVAGHESGDTDGAAFGTGPTYESTPPVQIDPVPSGPDTAPNADVDSSGEWAEASTEWEPANAPPVAHPPAARYASDLNHRVAADMRGRTLSEHEFKSLSRRSLLTGVVGAAAAVLGWRRLQGRPVDQWTTAGGGVREDRIPDVLRDVHQVNESIWRGLYRDGAQAPTFDYSESSMMRVNGRHGIREDLDLAAWELVVVGRNGESLGTHTLEELRSLQQVELTVEHKCVEGWAHVVTWGGVRFSDFVERFYPEQAQARFVGLATPDNEYRVGLDMDSMLHSQTLLALDLQREPLSDEHGAPVRLATPLKYGIKQIKRIGTIEFSDTQPVDDYWATRGYDWYAGL